MASAHNGSDRVGYPLRRADVPEARAGSPRPTRRFPSASSSGRASPTVTIGKKSLAVALHDRETFVDRGARLRRPGRGPPRRAPSAVPPSCVRVRAEFARRARMRRRLGRETSASGRRAIRADSASREPARACPRRHAPRPPPPVSRGMLEAVRSRRDAARAESTPCAGFRSTPERARGAPRSRRPARGARGNLAAQRLRDPQAGDRVGEQARVAHPFGPLERRPARPRARRSTSPANR